LRQCRPAVIWPLARSGFVPCFAPDVTAAAANAAGKPGRGRVVPRHPFDDFPSFSSNPDDRVVDGLAGAAVLAHFVFAGIWRH